MGINKSILNEEVSAVKPINGTIREKAERTARRKAGL